MLRKQKGFTLVELIFASVIMGAIVLALGMGYVIIHFIAKFW